MSKFHELSLAKKAAAMVCYYSVPCGLIHLGLWFQEDGLMKKAIVGFGGGAVLGYHIGGPHGAVRYSLCCAVVEPLFYHVSRSLIPLLVSKSAGGDEDSS